MEEKPTREMHDGFFDAAEYDAFDALVLQDFAYHTPIPAANDAHVLQVRVEREGQASDHLLMRGLATFSALDSTTEDRDVTVSF